LKLTEQSIDVVGKVRLLHHGLCHGILIICIINCCQSQQISCSSFIIKLKYSCNNTIQYNTMCQLENHMMRLLSSKYQIDVTLVDDNARIPAQQKSRRRRLAPDGATNKQERRWKSIMTQIGDTKDPSCLSAPKRRPAEDTFLSLPKRSSDESSVSHKLGDRWSQMSSLRANALPLALRSSSFKTVLYYPTGTRR
jgi:hypothetical protein